MAIRYLSGINVDSNTLFVDDANNLVGIGTASPTSELDVRGNNMGITGVAPTVLIYSNTTSGGKIAFVDQNWSSQIVGDSGRLRFNIGGTTEAMRIDNNGYVGIGTTSPGTKLDVNGGSDVTVAKFYNLSATATQVEIGDSGNSQYSNLLLLSNSGQAEIWKSGTGYTSYGGALALNIYNSNGPIAFHPNNTVNAMTIANTGNVGIGTTAPGTKLVVVGGDDAAGVGVLEIQTAGGTNLKIGGDTNYSWIQSHSSKPLYINQLGNNVILNSGGGNVGIGTTSPNYKLDVNGSINIYTGNSLRWGSGDVEILNSGYSMLFSTYTGSALTEKMRITSAGNVGIGTTSPVTTLQVNATSPAIRLQETGSGGDKRLELSVNSSGVATIAANQSAQVLTFETVGSERMRIASTGATRLNAYGSGSFTGTVAYNLAVDSSGNVIETAGGVVDGSGTANYITKWIDGNTVGNSLIYDDGTTITFQTGASERMRITSAGNVGIGTTSPAATLDIVSSGSIQTSILARGLDANFRLVSRQDKSSNDSGAIVGEFGVDWTTTRNSAIRFHRGGDVTGGFMTFTTNDGSERMRITAAGNVGIGTTAPDAKLVIVTGSTDDSGNSFSFTGYGSKEYVSISKLGFIRSRASDLNGANMHFIDNGGTNRMEMAVNTTSMTWYSHALSSTFMVFQHTTGNVGIGTTSPSSALDVSLSGGSTSGIRFKGWSDASTPYLLSLGTQTYPDQFQIKSVNGLVTMGIVGATGAAPDLAFQTNTTERMRITSAGNVGISKTNPVYTLDVNGSFRLDGTNGDFIVGSTGNDIYFTRDGSNYFVADQANSAISFLMGTGYAQSLFLKNDGNVGIGTTNPAYKLDISGVTRFQDVIRFKATAWQLSDSDSANRLYFSAYGRTYFGSQGGYEWRSAADTALAVITDAGNVGIGTTSPSALLHVSGTNTSILSSIVENTSSASGAYAGYTIKSDYAHSYLPGLLLNSSTNTAYAGADQLMLYQFHSKPISLVTNNIVRLMVSGAGDVGIGTTSPSYKLDVNGDVNIPFGTSNGYRINGNRILSQGSGFFEFGALDYKSTYPNISTNSDGTFRIQSNGSTLVTVNQSGNVGIGTTSPTTKLHVVGYSRNDGGLLLNGSDADYREIIFTTSAASRWNLYAYGGEGGSNAGSVLYLARYADNGDYIANVATFLRTNGYVGIATTTPTQQLHVSGNIRVTGAYYDSNNSAGSSGQVLSSTGSGTDWVSLSEITGVDGTGTANYIAKWSDTDTITNSSITDNGSTVTANVDRLNMNRQAGIYTFSKTLGATVASDFFSISNSHGAQAFRVTFVCSSSGYSVAKTYEVVHAFGQTPIYFKVVDTGPYGVEDFDVAFANSNSSTGVKATVTNNSATTAANIVATVFLGGGFETITVTAL